MNVKVTMIPGDGIGPEVSKATLRFLEAAGAKIDWVEMSATAVVGRRRGETEMNPRVESIRDWWEVWGWFLELTSAPSALCLKPFTGALPTLPAKTLPIPPP